MSLKKKFPKFQTVEWWIEQLKEMPNQKAVVQVATGPNGIKAYMLSIYEGHGKRPTVWIDIGESE